MSLVERISLIVRANIQDLLDKAEDPEKMIKQLIVEMKENLREAKIKTLSAIKEEHLLFQKYTECEKCAKEWEEKATLALKSNNDDLAKEALKKKKDYELQRDTFKSEFEKQSENVKMLKENIELLSEKIKDVENRKSLLVARKKIAEVKKIISKSIFDIEKNLEENVYLKEAEIELKDDTLDDTLEKKFRQLYNDRDIENEVETLKEKIKTQGN